MKYEKLVRYVDASHPIVYINTFEEIKADRILSKIAKETARSVYEWDNSHGFRIWDEKNGNIIKKKMGILGFADELSSESLIEFLEMYRKEKNKLDGKIIVLKDVHHFIEDPKVISLMKDLSNEILKGLECTVFIVSPKVVLPCELANYTDIEEIGYLEDFEIREIIDEFIDDYEVEDVSEEVKEKFKNLLKGLKEHEIKNILADSLSSNEGSLSKESFKLIYEQKKQTIKKSNILEMINVKEGKDDVGGLEELIKWVSRKAFVFDQLDKAKQFGVDMPKGVFIVGLPGCGKSLSAKAIAGIFDMPLLRMDLGRILGKYVGDSEQNMRNAIALAEAISPCVLWVDEIEKAFSGIGDNSGNEVTKRLFGNFLTWMQEKESPTFVVATANDILKMPPELVRKGRFDEMFYVGLPNFEERKKIFEIHIGKRRRVDLVDIDLKKLANCTEGFSGADIEGVVKEAIEDVFYNGENKLTDDILLKTIKNTESLSKIMGSKLDDLEKEYKIRNFKKASKY